MVGIDRPDEDDALDRRHDCAIADTDRHTAGRSGAGSELVDDSEAARAACYVEYRAKVAAEYGSGDDPWAAKRAAWAEALAARGAGTVGSVRKTISLSRTVPANCGARWLLALRRP